MSHHWHGSPPLDTEGSGGVVHPLPWDLLIGMVSMTVNYVYRGCFCIEDVPKTLLYPLKKLCTMVTFRALQVTLKSPMVLLGAPNVALFEGKYCSSKLQIMTRKSKIVTRNKVFKKLLFNDGEVFFRQTPLVLDQFVGVLSISKVKKQFSCILRHIFGFKVQNDKSHWKKCHFLPKNAIFTKKVLFSQISVKFPSSGPKKCFLRLAK